MSGVSDSTNHKLSSRCRLKWRKACCLNFNCLSSLEPDFFALLEEFKKLFSTHLIAKFFLLIRCVCRKMSFNKNSIWNNPRIQFRSRHFSFNPISFQFDFEMGWRALQLFYKAIFFYPLVRPTRLKFGADNNIFLLVVGHVNLFLETESPSTGTFPTILVFFDRSDSQLNVNWDGNAHRSLKFGKHSSEQFWEWNFHALANCESNRNFS